MKTIIITGGYGFIGSNFVIQELRAGNKVINIDKMTYAANKANLAGYDDNADYTNSYIFKLGDICDEAFVQDIVTTHQPDYIVNFAAESHVDNSINSPKEFIETNINGVYNLLNITLKYYESLTGDKQRDFRFLQVSTDEVFGSLALDDPKFCEETPYDPRSPYSSSKAAADHLVKAWFHTYKLPAIITNCSNNFGARQHREKLIPKVVSCCINEQNIPIYGTGTNIRDWIFVEDHCRGVKLALTQGKLGESYCFGGNMELTNIELVRQICQIMDKKKPRKNGKPHSKLIEFVTDRKGHDLRYAIDNAKSNREFGFVPSSDFNNNLERTIDWFLRYSASIA